MGLFLEEQIQLDDELEIQLSYLLFNFFRWLFDVVALDKKLTTHILYIAVQDTMNYINDHSNMSLCGRSFWSNICLRFNGIEINNRFRDQKRKFTFQLEVL